jgi:hypothetical protein
VATALNSTVSNCKKRWKSLRDTFIKYYRIEQMQDKSSDTKRRRWLFYNDLRFLQKHVELFRLDGTRADDTIPIYLKEDYIEVHEESDKHIFYEEGDAVRYQIKIDQDDEETDQNDEEQLLETYIEEPKDQHVEEDIIVNKSDQSSEYIIVEAPEGDPNIQSKNEEVENSDKGTSSEPIERTITDPDERYLLSCLPAFKRLSPQQKSLVRMGIEKLFYEVEFEGPPLTKKFKSN